MSGSTHVACSVALVGVYALANPEGAAILGVTIVPAVSLLAVPVGAKAPDVDIQQSRLGKKFSYLSKHMKHRGITHTLVGPIALFAAMLLIRSLAASVVACLFVGWIIGLMYDKPISKKNRTPISLVKDILKAKRGLSVTLILLALVYYSPSTGASVVFGLFAGWTLHIIEDLFNRPGCPLGWPLVKGRFHIPGMAVKTRHWSEGVFAVIWIGGCVLWGLLIVDGQSQGIQSIFQNISILG